MRQFAVVGTTYKQAQQSLLNKLTIAEHDLDYHLAKLHQYCDFVESVYLATCNRVEIFFWCHSDVAIEDYRQRIFDYMAENILSFSDREQFRQAHSAASLFQAYGGEGAIERLFLIASAVDSMMPGEAQILGQLKQAFIRAKRLDTANGHLEWIFNAAFSAAKKVRNDTRLAHGRVSLLSLAVQQIAERLQKGTGKLVVLGSGKMGKQCADLFADDYADRLLLVNRRFAKAEELAKTYGGEAMDLCHFLENPNFSIDTMVLATQAQENLLDKSFFQKLRYHGQEMPLIVDVTIQRNCSPELAAIFGVDFWDLDRLERVSSQTRDMKHKELAEARIVVQKCLLDFLKSAAEKASAKSIRLLREYMENCIDTALLQWQEEYLNHKIQQAEYSSEALRCFKHLLLQKLGHTPALGLKQLALMHGEGVLDVFSQVFTEIKENSLTFL
jgi:glutamyl-tRNA reductase